MTKGEVIVRSGERDKVEGGQSLFDKWLDDKFREGKDPDYFKSFFELTEDVGLQGECHVAQTVDGYLLNIFRVKTENLMEGAPVVFMQHGLFGSADNFVMNGEKSPAFMLAKAGYDVWVGNSRGSRYSKGHISLDSEKDYDYWKFSIDSMANSDLPAAIDYVRGQTGRSKVSFFAHSQGTTQIVMAMATDLEFWKQRLNLVLACPPVIISDDKNVLYDSGQRVYPFLERTLANYGIFEMFGQNWDNLIKTVKVFVPKLQDQIVSQYTVGDLNDPARAQVFFGHYPHGASVRNLAHLGQIVSRGELIHYDFMDEEQNLKAYGSRQAKKIDISKIRDIPFAMFTGKYDRVVSVEKNRLFAEMIPAVTYFEEVEADHITFLIGRDMSYMEKVKGLLQKHN
eukprot:CAMPEP_0168618152 /NCGR_PEP_ID=MMETSP0449_2-20121227/5922_1 /TAXON_ID=1082188 /ORGANISM="Strombidium rassoulzadegani, Strain ras09" /LENGTH=396 /DNA_ID=CAMNT_0008659013 /DNA_START=769 /DNA_END=1956 /DNA_ORIENTATION=+